MQLLRPQQFCEYPLPPCPSPDYLTHQCRNNVPPNLLTTYLRAKEETLHCIPSLDSGPPQLQAAESNLIQLLVAAKSDHQLITFHRFLSCLVPPTGSDNIYIYIVHTTSKLSNTDLVVKFFFF